MEEQQQTRNVGWCDCHCHLDEYADPEAVIRDAEAAGVTRICAVAQWHEECWRSILSLADKHPGVVVPGIGIHPCPDGDEMLFMRYGDDEKALSDLRTEMLGYKGRVAVVGEIGLDYKWASDAEKRTTQRHLFDAQLAIAAELGLPISVHSRRSARDAMEACVKWHRETGLGACLHWFTHSAKLMRQAAQGGVFVSVGPAGAITEEDERDFVKKVGKECLGQMLFETDGPVRFQGEEATPAWIPRIGEAVSQLIEVPVDDVMTATFNNFERYLTMKK